MRHSHPSPGGNDAFFDRGPSDDSDDLVDLQGKVLEALEAANHPFFKAANKDSALRDGATADERKAWLAVYGPLTTVDPTAEHA